MPIGRSSLRRKPPANSSAAHGAVVATGGRLLGPDPELIALAADKQRLCERLENQNVPLPVGAMLHDGEPLPRGIRFPAIIKPRDGCGAEGVRLVHDAACLERHLRQSHELRVENYCPGIAASVAILGGTRDRLVLPAWVRRSSCARIGSITAAATSRSSHRSRCGHELAAAVADALPDWIGYLGIDLVLGPADDGSDDVVIEMNPRLTTSYVGLRVAAQQNLAATMSRSPEGNSRSFRSRWLRSDSCPTARSPISESRQEQRRELARHRRWRRNLKVADGRGYGESVAFPLWKAPGELTAAPQAMLALRTIGRCNRGDDDRRAGRLFRHETRGSEDDCPRTGGCGR